MPCDLWLKQDTEPLEDNLLESGEPGHISWDFKDKVSSALVVAASRYLGHKYARDKSRCRSSAAVTSKNKHTRGYVDKQVT